MKHDVRLTKRGQGFLAIESKDVHGTDIYAIVVDGPTTLYGDDVRPHAFMVIYHIEKGICVTETSGWFKDAESCGEYFDRWIGNAHR